MVDLLHGDQKKLGLKCKIFISEYVSEFRAKVMRSFGADVIRVKGNYDNSLKRVH